MGYAEREDDEEEEEEGVELQEKVNTPLLPQ
jgi:hypothetical protein